MSSRLPRLALRNVGRNRRRSIITGVTIVFGVAMVLLVRGFTGGMSKMMVDDVVSGTGWRAAIDGIQVAGKTGTAELADSESHAWFTAFAPADDPQIAVVVILENDPGDGGSSAAPVAREIIRAKLGL